MQIYLQTEPPRTEEDYQGICAGRRVSFAASFNGDISSRVACFWGLLLTEVHS